MLIEKPRPILSGACCSCRCSLGCLLSVRRGRGFQAAVCVTHVHTRYVLKKKQMKKTKKRGPNLFRSRNNTVKSSTRAELKCFNHGKQGEVRTKGVGGILVSCAGNSKPADCLHKEFSPLCWDKKKTNISSRGVSQRVTLCVWNQVLVQSESHHLGLDCNS